MLALRCTLLSKLLLLSLLTTCLGVYIPTTQSNNANDNEVSWIKAPLTLLRATVGKNRDASKRDMIPLGPAKNGVLDVGVLTDNVQGGHRVSPGGYSISDKEKKTTDWHFVLGSILEKHTKSDLVTQSDLEPLPSKEVTALAEALHSTQNTKYKGK